jgi:hypothetical protein
MASRASFPLRAFFGHHKCATGWTDTILMDLCYHMGLNFKIVHREIEFADYDSLAAFTEAHDVDFLAYTNAKVEHTRDLPLEKGFHVVRDPRDVLVSAYFSHLHSHPTSNWPELAEHRDQLAALSKEEGLFCEMDFSAEEFEDMYRWDYTQDNILELKMENLTADPVTGFVQIMDFLEMLDDQTRGLQRMVKSATLKANRLLYKGRHVLPTEQAPTIQRHHTLSERKVKSIVQKNSFSNLSGGRQKGKENVKSHLRKGVPGDWVNHFTPDHKRAFKKRFNDVLIKMGYEDDSNW